MSGEPTTHRLIPTCRDSTIEQMFPNPTRGLHGLDLSFTGHGSRSRLVRLGPYQFPRAVFASEFADDFVCAIVVLESAGKVVRLAGVEAASGILQNVRPVHCAKLARKLAPSRHVGRTYNITVNPDSSGPVLKKPLKRLGILNGSRGRARTYNITVNSRALYH